MTSMKRFGLAALFAIGMALSTSSPARAQEGEDWGTITLTNTAAAKDRDHGASGWATLTGVTYGTRIWGEFPNEYAEGVAYGSLTVRCEGLTPRAPYYVGPTDLDSVTFWKQHVQASPSYSYVTASDTGTVELAVQVAFYSGCSYQWVEEPWWPWGYWELVGCSYYFPLQVLRTKGTGNKNMTPVLAGDWYFEP